MLLLFLVFVKYFLDKGKLCFGPPHKSTAIISDWVFMSVVCKCGDISMTNTCEMLLHDGWHRWYNTSCLLWLKKQSHWCSSYSRRRSTKRSENNLLIHRICQWMKLIKLYRNTKIDSRSWALIFRVLAVSLTRYWPCCLYWMKKIFISMPYVYRKLGCRISGSVPLCYSWFPADQLSPVV